MCHFQLTAASLDLKGHWEKENKLTPFDYFEYIATWKSAEYYT